MVGVVIALEMAFVLMRGFQPTQARPRRRCAGAGQHAAARHRDLHHYLYPLQIAAVLLLVAIIAAIALTLRRRKDSRYLNPSEQVRVKAADRVRW
jgi:NADH-quinone oxidoreductase subunit J